MTVRVSHKPILDTNTVLTGFTEGSVLFVDSVPSLAQDNANFFWDATTKALVIGNPGQVAFGTSPTLQVLGTAGTDSSIGLARWSNNSSSSTFTFLKSRDGAIGSFTIVQDNDLLGRIRFFCR